MKERAFVPSCLRAFVIVVGVCLASVAPRADSPLGYYRFPALSGDLLVFTAEGDLWKTTVDGGVPERLTAHPGQETDAAVSPDGKWVAFTGTYEGPEEAYVLPLEGGPPRRLTWDGGPVAVVAWTPDGKVLISTRRYSTLPNETLMAIDPVSGAQTAVPLAQASDGIYAADGTLYFTRLPFQGSQTRRYKGGTAQQLWRLAPGAPEAVPVTADFSGTSKRPMIWNDRLYFLSDRDGTMNVWSMALAGGGLTQHTRHADYEAQGASLSAGRIAYQHGADIRVYDIAANADRVVPIRLVSDFDHVRERWVTAPFEWVTAAHLSPTGDRVVLTARGQLFVAPVEQGRLVEATRNPKARYRNGRFMPDGQSLVGLSDESGEVEFWRVPANGLGPVDAGDHRRRRAALGWPAVARREVHRALRQGSAVVGARTCDEEADQAGVCRQRRLRRPGVVARQPVPRLHRARSQHAHSHLRLGGRHAGASSQ